MINHDDFNYNLINRIFTGKSNSILSYSIDYLISIAKESNPIDLSDILVIVPTKNSSRKLRESLAIEASKRNSGILSPLVSTIDFLYSHERIIDSISDNLNNQNVMCGNPKVTLWAWMAVMLEINIEEFPNLFPNSINNKSFTWAKNKATELVNIRRTLCESMHTFSTALKVFIKNDIEIMRWKELSILENKVLDKISEYNILDESEILIKASREGKLPSNIKKIIIVGETSLSKLAVNAIKNYALNLKSFDSFSIDVIIQADQSDDNLFNEFGIPITSCWENKDINIDISNINISSNPTNQGRLISAMINDYLYKFELNNIDNEIGNKLNESKIGVGVLDSKLVSTLEESMSDKGIRTYDPSGKNIKKFSVYYVLEETKKLLNSHKFSVLRNLFNSKFFKNIIISHISPNLDDLLKEDLKELTKKLYFQINEINRSHMPIYVEDAYKIAKELNKTSKKNYLKELILVLKFIIDFFEEFETNDFETFFKKYISNLFSDINIEGESTLDKIINKLATSIEEFFNYLEVIRSLFNDKKLSNLEIFDLFLDYFSASKIYLDKTSNDIRLSGWMELLWEQAPRLFISGMNEENIPETIVGHFFLPDKAREMLGIITNQDKYARDAYMLNSIVEVRNNLKDGNITFFLCREDESQTPLKPSRLLFHCSNDKLVEKVTNLFKVTDINSRVKTLFKTSYLKPTKLSKDNRIFKNLTPSLISSYLYCPFKFYMENGLGMTEEPYNKNELDSRDFGNIIHSVLDSFANDKQASELINADEISNFFKKEVNKQFNNNFGSRMSTAITLQKESAIKRLEHWAKIESRERLLGWKIRHSEFKFENNFCSFNVGNIPIKGRIDRIDYHNKFGYRIIDFKVKSSSIQNKSNFVKNSHLNPLTGKENSEDFPNWRIVSFKDSKGNDKIFKWINLQLLIYKMAFSKTLKDQNNDSINVSYGLIGREESSIKLLHWDDIDNDLIIKSRECIEGVIESINKHIFWPPSALNYNDESLFKNFITSNPNSFINSDNLLIK